MSCDSKNVTDWFILEKDLLRFRTMKQVFYTCFIQSEKSFFINCTLTSICSKKDSFLCDNYPIAEIRNIFLIVGI